MDTSSKFIEMCEQANEIQQKWRYSGIYDGMNRLKEGIAKAGDDVLFQSGSNGKERVVWLPRQEQLQAMVKDEGVDDFSLVELFYNYVWGDGQPKEIGSPLDTMERMWLAFVMLTLYQKVWNGQEWLKILAEL